MTWGELRHTLTIGAPGFSPDLIDSYINARYGQYLDHYPWKGLEEEAVIESLAGYATGTVSVAVGSTALTGVGTTFTSGMTGRRILISSAPPVYTVTYVGATSLTLDRGYEASAAASAASFTIFQNVYELPADLKTVLEISSPVTGLPLGAWSRAKMDQAVGFRAELADADYYAMDVDTSEDDPPVVHQVELYPCPILSKGYALRYQKAAVSFDGESTGTAPLPFVSTVALVDGCRADIQRQLKDFNAADRYEALWMAELARQMRVDQVRRGPKQVQMAAGLTAYRRRRVSR